MNNGVESTQMRSTLRRIGATAPEIIELFDYLEDVPLSPALALGPPPGS